jgi:hypothetical protein
MLVKPPDFNLSYLAESETRVYSISPAYFRLIKNIFSPIMNRFFVGRGILDTPQI